jgi:hypothetical protein
MMPYCQIKKTSIAPLYLAQVAQLSGPGPEMQIKLLVISHRAKPGTKHLLMAHPPVLILGRV